MELLSEFYFTNQLLQSEFCAENFFFTMNFKEKIPKICLILDNFGPFFGNKKGILPLWCLTVLEKMNLGFVIGPKWLKTKWLKKKIFLEIEEENLESIPRNYFETIWEPCSISELRVGRGGVAPPGTLLMVSTREFEEFNYILTLRE